MEVNNIKELYPGHYQAILDFPIAQDLSKILDKSYKYVWGINHNEGRSSWSVYNHTLFGVKQSEGSIYARNVSMEFLIETLNFVELLPDVKQTINVLQVNQIPPSFLDLSRLKGKARYDLLKDKVDYLFEIEIPGATDYSSIISPNKSFLEGVIKALD